jgi:hypothetical protein
MSKFDQFEDAYRILQRKLNWGGRYHQEALSLEERAHKNARDFLEGDKARAHFTGCTDFSTSKAVVYAIEAVRALNQGSSGNPDALALLELAAAEVQECLTKREQRDLLEAMPPGPMQ